MMLIMRLYHSSRHHAGLALKRIRRYSGLERLVQRWRLPKLLEQYYGLKPKLPPRGLRVALILRDGNRHPKSSAFIRLIGPLTHPSIRSKITIQVFKENTRSLPDYFDVCIVQRTAFDTPELAQELVDYLKGSHIPLIVDNDDAFHLVDNDHSEFVQHAAHYKALDYLIKEADELWVSTAPLKKLYQAANKRIVVIPNSLDRRVISNNQAHLNKKASLQLVYMGTATHDADFAMVLRVLNKLADVHPNSFKLTVIGVSSQTLPEKTWIERIIQPKGSAIYPAFMKWFSTLGPFDIGLCPLIESPFNDCKSDIKCLDYIGSGIMPLVSEVPAYNTSALNPFVVRVRNRDEDWVAAFDDILRDLPRFRQQQRAKTVKAKAYLWEKRSATVTAHLLLTRLTKLKNRT